MAGLVQPALQCQWTGPAAGDPYPSHIQVLGTPMVIDFDFDSDPTTIQPSIVFNTYDGLDGDSGSITTLNGVLRIIDGSTCAPQFTLGPNLNGRIRRRWKSTAIRTDGPRSWPTPITEESSPTSMMR